MASLSQASGLLLKCASRRCNIQKPNSKQLEQAYSPGSRIARIKSDRSITALAEYT